MTDAQADNRDPRPHFPAPEWDGAEFGICIYCAKPATETVTAHLPAYKRTIQVQACSEHIQQVKDDIAKEPGRD